MGYMTVLNEKTGERRAVVACPSCRESMSVPIGAAEHECERCGEELEFDWQQRAAQEPE